MAHDTYTSPFQTRYASKEMQYMFSEEHKFRTWRRLWVALAEAEQAEGLAITDAQIAELKAHIGRRELRCGRHAPREGVPPRRDEPRLRLWRAVPGAKGIIHLGATSCYVGDNTDLLVMRDGLEVLRRKLLNTMAAAGRICPANTRPCPRWPTPIYQPAQLTTVGKRAALWLGELYLD